MFMIIGLEDMGANGYDDLEIIVINPPFYIL